MIQFQNEYVTVFESALFRTTSTVVITEDLVLVVDPNWLPNEIKEIQQFVAENRKNRSLYLLFTHSDYDHIIGYKAFPEAKVIVSEAFQNNPEKERSLQEIFRFDNEYYITRDYKIEYPIGDLIIKKDYQKITFGKTNLTFYLAPGHNRDGIFTIVEPLNVWISGDYLSNEEFPYIYYSSIEYEKTLGKVENILDKHEIKMLIPGHGDVAFDKAKMLARKNENLEYISELRNSLKSGKKINLEKLWEKYRFPKVMTRFHEANVELMKKEIEGKN